MLMILFSKKTRYSPLGFSGYKLRLIMDYNITVKSQWIDQGVSTFFRQINSEPLEQR
jgi:hypothetical protein